MYKTSGNSFYKNNSPTNIMARFSKTIFFILFCSSLTGTLHAYEIDQTPSKELSQKVRAHLIINTVDKRLELEFANRTIRENIGIDKSAIR